MMVWCKRISKPAMMATGVIRTPAPVAVRSRAVAMALSKRTWKRAMMVIKRKQMPAATIVVPLAAEMAWSTRGKRVVMTETM